MINRPVGGRSFTPRTGHRCRLLQIGPAGPRLGDRHPRPASRMIVSSLWATLGSVRSSSRSDAPPRSPGRRTTARPAQDIPVFQPPNDLQAIPAPAHVGSHHLRLNMGETPRGTEFKIPILWTAWTLRHDTSLPASSRLREDERGEPSRPHQVGARKSKGGRDRARQLKAKVASNQTDSKPGRHATKQPCGWTV